ncbi:TonB-dependent receptor [Caulobacter segnis]|uniref:TonB-dependent receptor n=1 Tax=Caulobacter segnis TaxID=88688 RepID=UPI002867858E|nr:TonB-dependent receptor [Caulobacter segnis]MDR6624203.1 iron complex outermembrane receptor protein [Caulobacter segnis]
MAAASALGGMLALAGPAPAAEAPGAADDNAVDQIVISARRREEKLQDAPITVSAVSGRVLETERLDRVADYAAKIANFAALQQNARVSTLTVRGVGGNANSDGSEAGVGLMVDGVFLTHPGFSWLDFVDLDHIELARGPQGTLLGKNTTVGALVVTTKAPSYAPEAMVGVTAASRDRRQLRVNLSGPLVADKIAGRLTLYGDTGGGWVRNKADAKRYLDNHRWAVRGQLLFDPNTRFSDRLIVEHYDTREYNNYTPAVADPLTYANGAPRNGWARRLATGFGYTPSYDVEDANFDAQARAIARTDGVSNIATFKLGDHVLTSISAWRRFHYRPNNDSDGTPYPIFRSGYDVDVDQYSQELRLASPEGGAVDWQTGIYLLKQEARSNYRVRLLSKATAFFVSPRLPDAVLEGVEGDQIGVADTTSAAIFAHGTWHASDRAALAAGLRYTHEDREASNTAVSFGGAALIGRLAPYAAYRAAVTGPDYVVRGRREDGSLSWLINPSYRISEGVLAYASLSYGEKSGAANLGARPGDRIIIDPEKSTDYELGVKTTLAGGRATLNVNLYRDTIDGYQAPYIDPAGATARSYLANVGKVRLRGIEAEGAAQVTRRLNLSFAAAWGEAIYVSYANAPPPAELTYAGAPPTADLSGEQMSFAPNLTGNVSARWEQPLAGGLHLFAYANETWRGRSALTPLSAYARQSGYALTNAGVGLRGQGDRWSATLWAKNLFDKRYAIGFAGATSITPYAAILGDPRTVGVTLTARPF